MGRQIDPMMMYKVASYYYKDGLSQMEIAEMERISRSQISRILDRARASGMVRVSVALPENKQASQLAQTLERRLKLSKVVIAQSAAEERKRAHAIASAAACYLPEALKGCRLVGIGWGQTVYETSLQMPYSRDQDAAVFVPLVGVSGVANPVFQMNTIIDRMAERRRAKGYFLSLPTFRQKMLPMADVDKKRVACLKAYWKKLDAAVFGLGTIRQAERFMQEEASSRFMTTARNSAAQGEILSRFFYEDGRPLQIHDDAIEQLAFRLEDLHKVPKTICLAGGPEKVPVLIQAARCRFFNHLVTDRLTAERMIQTMDGEAAV